MLKVQTIEPTEIQFDQVAFGRDFHDQGMAELGKAVHGETMAKLGYLAAAVAGENILYYGAPGGGKSVMLFEAPRLFGEAGEHDIKRIPPQSDLTGKQITGGSVVTNKEIVSGTKRSIETVTNTIEPILHEDVRIIIGDEINRANPFAIGAMLEGLESGRVITNDGIVNLTKFMFAALAINPPGVDRTVHGLSSALVSRMSIGARMGEDSNNIIEAALEKKLSRPDEMEQVATFEQLEVLQRIAEDKSVSGQVVTAGSAVIEALHNGLNKVQITEGKGRLAVQVTNVASALAVLRGNTEVTLADIVLAAKFGAESRLGANNFSKNDVEAFFEDSVISIARINDKERQWSSVVAA